LKPCAITVTGRRIRERKAAKRAKAENRMRDSYRMDLRIQVLKRKNQTIKGGARNIPGADKG
jgi:hypothetical protein